MKRKTKYDISRKWFLVAALLPMGCPDIAAADESWPIALREQMQRISDVSYRIGRIAEPACQTKGSLIGVSLDFIDAYDPRERASTAALLKMSEYPQIATIATGSPAQAAGLLPGEDLLAINGTGTLEMLSSSPQKALFADELEQRFVQQQPGTTLTLTVRQPGSASRQVQIIPQGGCAARTVIKTGLGITAFSDGTNVAVSSKLIKFAKNDDELALIVGHELGHIINGDGDARSLQQRRKMEDRADAWGVALVKCAGYDVETALQFWLRRDAQDWLRMLRSPTHRSRKKRVALMRAEAAVTSCLIARLQSHDQTKTEQLA